MKQFIARHQHAFAILGIIAALAIAAVYLFVVPSEAANVTGAAWLVLRYGHSACWVLLALAAGLWLVGVSKKIVTWVSYGALACYALFILTLITVRVAAG